MPRPAHGRFGLFLLPLLPGCAGDDDGIAGPRAEIVTCGEAGPRQLVADVRAFDPERRYELRGQLSDGRLFVRAGNDYVLVGGCGEPTTPARRREAQAPSSWQTMPGSPDARHWMQTWPTPTWQSGVKVSPVHARWVIVASGSPRPPRSWSSSLRA